MSTQSKPYENLPVWGPTPKRPRIWSQCIKEKPTTGIIKIWELMKQFWYWPKIMRLKYFQIPLRKTILFACINYKLSTVYQTVSILNEYFYLSSFLLNLPWERNGGFTDILLRPIYYGPFAMVVNFVAEWWVRKEWSKKWMEAEKQGEIKGGLSQKTNSSYILIQLRISCKNTTLKWPLNENSNTKMDCFTHTLIIVFASVHRICSTHRHNTHCVGFFWRP